MNEKKPGRPKSKDLQNATRRTFWIPNIFFKDKPPQMSDSDWIRKLIKESLNGSATESPLLAGLIKKLIQIFIEQEIDSKEITFTDKEYDYIIKKAKEMEKNE